MPSTGNWNNTSYSIPLAGELNWSTLSAFLIDLRNNAQTTNFQKVGARVATSTPVTVLAASDCIVDINIGSASAVNLPAGATGQIFMISDGSGAAATNNITIDANAAETINGAATLVINRNRGTTILAWNGTEWRIVSDPLAVVNTTGTGNVVLSASPTFTGTILADQLKCSGAVAVGTVAATAGNKVEVQGGFVTGVTVQAGGALGDDTVGSAGGYNGGVVFNVTQISTLSFATTSMLFVISQPTNGNAACVYADYASGTITLLASPSGDYAAGAPPAAGFGITKSATSFDIVITSGGSISANTNLQINAIGTRISSFTTPV